MDNSLLVRFMHCRANLLKDVHHPLQRQSLLLGEHIAKRATIEVLHHEIRDSFCSNMGEPKIGNINNVRMAQATSGAGLALEARDKLFVTHELRRDQLQRYVAFSAQVSGQVDCAHSASSEQSLEAILFIASPPRLGEGEGGGFRRL